MDDNVDAAESLSLMVRLWGHETALAYDGLEAVPRARTFGPDVMVVDIGLPGLNGYDVARRIRADAARGNKVVLIALTGYGSAIDQIKAREAGFDNHLVQPVDPVALEKLLAGLRIGTV